MRDIRETNEKFNIKEHQLELLKDIFPQFFSKNDEFDLMKFETEILKVTNAVKDGYTLNWLGKTYAKVISYLDTDTMISPDMVHNSKEENKKSNNIYIKGDNLEVLKHLKNAYNSKVKLIYIDPPYNTESDNFMYKDKFNFTPEKLSQLADIDIDEATQILEFTDRNSSSHSAWLTFMYPRLFIARQLLKEEGIILISIDDNQYSQLKILCDEIFSEGNYVGTITWEKRTKAQNTEDARNMLQSKTEYILIYRKKDQKINFKLEVKSHKEYPEQDEKGIFRYKKVEQMAAQGMRKRDTMIFPILGIMPQEGNQWKQGIETIQSFIDRGDLVIRDNNPIMKIRPQDEDARSYFPFWSHFFDKDSYGTAESGKKELSDILGTNKHDFETVKPVKLIKKILFHTNTEDNEIIMDFFSGSGTTAQAVMELNAEDDKIKNRRYIMVQESEQIDKDSSAIECGYKYISDLGIDRIQKAAKKIFDSTHEDIDYGFKLYEITSINEDTFNIMDDFKPQLIVEDNIVNSLGKDTILTTWLLQDGHQLTETYEVIDLNGYEAYKVDETLYLLNKSFSISSNFTKLVELLEKDDDFIINKIVILGYSFNTETLLALKDNVRHLINGRKSADIQLEERY